MGRNRPGGSLAAAVAAPTVATAQGAPYPNQRINFIVGFAAGGFADTIARWVAARLGERTGQTVVVQNMEGGGGIRAARRGRERAARRLHHPGHHHVARDQRNPWCRIAAIPRPVRGGVAAVIAPESLSVSAKGPIKTLAELVNEAKAGKVFMGSAGIGTGSHIAAEYFFKVLAKAPVKHIPFPGGDPAMMGLLTGDVNVLAATATGNISRAVNNGDMIGLGHRRGRAVARSCLRFRPSPKPAIPECPAASWVGFFAPAGTPEAVLAKLNSEINAILQEPEIAKRIETAGLQTTVRGRAESAKLFSADIENWSTMVEAVGVPKQ